MPLCANEYVKEKEKEEEEEEEEEEEKNMTFLPECYSSY